MLRGTSLDDTPLSLREVQELEFLFAFCHELLVKRNCFTLWKLSYTSSDKQKPCLAQYHQEAGGGGGLKRRGGIHLGTIIL